jgi:serine/threonine-protein kinase HipA
VSALTLFGLAEMMARYASYADLNEIIRHRFAQPREMLRELFGRLVFNILCGNTDDHARNHAAFWNGQQLALTPAYDLCPQIQTGQKASQTMLITDDDRMSRLKTCLAAASNFLLDTTAAEDLIADQIERLHAAWPEVAEEAALTKIDCAVLAGRVFLNPFIFEGAPPRLSRARLAT